MCCVSHVCYVLCSVRVVCVLCRLLRLRVRRWCVLPGVHVMCFCSLCVVLYCNCVVCVSMLSCVCCVC